MPGVYFLKSHGKNKKSNLTVTKFKCRCLYYRFREMKNHDELIGRCKAGQRDAQLEIYRQYYRPMYNTCLRIVKISADAEDIMQNSFIDAFRNIRKYRGEAPFNAWLRRIVINNSIRHIKHKSQIIELTDAIPDFAYEPDDYREEFVEMRIEGIKKAMYQIRDEYRIILSLNLFEGMDLEEIGDILKLNPGNVRTRLSRARAALIAELKNQDHTIAARG
jgi:RNA polymerase sigma-70 factor (ECF subfamily)